MPAQTADSEARPYMPTFAQEVELIPDWVGRANAYLNDTGNGSLQATFPMLKLNIPLNMVAALNLLDDTNKGRVVANTRKAAAKLVRTKTAADLEQTTKSVHAHQKELQPDPNRVTTPEFRMSLLMAIAAFQVIMARMATHSNEFSKVKRQHLFDLGVVVCIIFEALLDHRDGAHESYFVDKFPIGLPSNGPTAISPSPSSSDMLPFTTKVARFLAEKPSRIKLARLYLEKSRLFSEISSLDLNGRAVREKAVNLLSTPKDDVRKEIVDLTAQAATYLNEFSELGRGARQVAQSGSLRIRLIRLAAALVADRKRKFPMEFVGRGTIKFNILIVIALIYEVFTAHGDEGSYIWRMLAAAARAARRAAASKSAVTPKRTIAQTNTESAHAESSDIDHKAQPEKRRKKQVKKKQVKKKQANKEQASEKQTQEPAGKGNHLEEIDSDPESSLFIPQADSDFLVAAPSDTSSEAFDKALEEAQKKSVFSKGSEGPSSPPPTTSDGSAPQKQRSGSLLKSMSHKTVPRDQAHDSDGVLNRQNNDRNARREPHNNTSPTTATGAEKERQIKNPSTATRGKNGKKRGRNVRK